MLYPVNIKIENKSNFQKIKEKLSNFQKVIFEKINYLVLNRKNWLEIILVKLHI